MLNLPYMKFFFRVKVLAMRNCLQPIGSGFFE